MSNLDMTIFRPGCHMVSMGDGISIFPPKGGAAAGNGLLNNLIAYWPGNEVAGNALDLHTNALHLTDTNTVTSNPGLVYPLARQYTAANNESHMRPGDDALLSTGDVDFTLATCCYFDAVVSNRITASKVTGGLEYLTRTNAAGQGQFVVYPPPAGPLTSVTGASFGAIPATTWVLIIGWHDSVANTINIQVNNGVVDSLAHATGVLDNTGVFSLGAAAGLLMDGRIGPTMFWKSGPGLGGVKTPAERLAFWNGGVPLTYAAFTV